MRVFAIVVEPADYTLDLIRNIYIPRGVEWCYICGSSKASVENSELTHRPVLSEMGWLTRLRFVWNALKTHSAFVVNGWTLKPNLELFFLNWLFFRKPMAWESDTELRVPSQFLKRFVKRMWLGMIFRRAFCYGFPGGTYQQKELFRYYGMHEERISIAPMVVDNDRYKYRSRVHGECFKFIFIGRLIALKQVDKIIRALPTGCELLVVGEGEERARLETAAQGKPVKFCGALFGMDKIRLMHTADCLVLYSTHDQWGYVINEALASGMPVIVSDQVGCRHDLVEGEKPTGLVAKWDDGVDLADKMRQISFDRILYGQMSENAEARMAHWNYGYYGSQFDAWLGSVTK